MIKYWTWETKLCQASSGKFYSNLTAIRTQLRKITFKESHSQSVEYSNYGACTLPALNVKNTIKKQLITVSRIITEFNYYGLASITISKYGL
jgi:hypothetical protein